MSTAQALERFRDFYNTFSASWLDRLEELYAPSFEFNDPFHSITADYAAQRAYFAKILSSLHHSKFVVEDIATGSDGSYVRWRWE